MKKAKFKIRKSKDEQYYFTLNASNGKVLMTSETYVKKSNCQTGINAVEVAFLDNGLVLIVDETLKG